MKRVIRANSNEFVGLVESLMLCHPASSLGSNPVRPWGRAAPLSFRVGDSRNRPVSFPFDLAPAPGKEDTGEYTTQITVPNGEDADGLDVIFRELDYLVGSSSHLTSRCWKRATEEKRYNSLRLRITESTEIYAQEESGSLRASTLGELTAGSAAMVDLSLTTVTWLENVEEEGWVANMHADRIILLDYLSADKRRKNVATFRDHV